MKLNRPTYLVFSLLMLFCVGNMTAQSKKQQELEARRQQLQKEIEQINSLLFTNRKKEKSMVTIVEDLNNKVRVRQNLIKVTNDQANLLTREINNNQKEITSLRDQLKELKEDYAAMVVKSYKSKSEQSRVMFLLSSDNFKQAYKRLQYIKQYTRYQEQQGEEIKSKTQKLQDLNTSLLQQKKDKEKLIEENRIAKKQLEEDIKEQQEMVALIRKDLTKYSSQIKSKQQEADRIDREIERLIKEAIAEANRKANKSNKASETKSSSGFALTPEAKATGANFEANKGKLSWPVEKGVVKTRYGTQPSPIDPSISIQSNGVRIATEEGSKVRAVFQGTVTAVIASKTGNPTVLIQHGNYFTAYKNLSKVYVKKGDKVDTKQFIGEVFTTTGDHETILSFSIFKVVSGESKTQDPSGWIYRM
ncbi:peptidoglycan DD-metalloendopeptidase family protein [Subsaxibacter sp. CAU 1640]|uniref:murein hydrolase activator EnvC family protein n=1 Tax=Subsaxibacter sp. CAU 1640 TaxID=2933271 RepID=UPI002005BA77|nr:peptidoglycan DD-metalloendopeptidase family protein [Subsaxibacter sp. CAU 1640]MCK7589566.1 peptidoglycan DD-metalloendopeptidase family protein [Subsaxibacter sp. CAU 1640]